MLFWWNIFLKFNCSSWHLEILKKFFASNPWLFLYHIYNSSCRVQQRSFEGKQNKEHSLLNIILSAFKLSNNSVLMKFTHLPLYICGLSFWHNGCFCGNGKHSTDTLEHQPRNVNYYLEWFIITCICSGPATYKFTFYIDISLMIL